MLFVFPWFLLALVALSIPVIVHLFNFRRYKTIYFSNVKFLRDVKEETSSRNKLKHLLVLATRLLALFFLVLAFAQPYLPSKNSTVSTGRKHLSLYIDNSFSMNAVHGGSSLFEKAKQTAKEIVQNYSDDDRFLILTNDFEGRHQRLLSKEEFFSLLNELEVSPAVREWPEITKRQKDVLSRENAKNQMAYLLSDFQQNMGDLYVDSQIAYNLIPLASEAQANAYIDTAWFLEPVTLLNAQANLVVKISNSGDNAVANNRLVLKLNGQTKGMDEFSIAPNSYILDTLHFVLSQPNWNRAELQIQDFPITFDDTYFITFNVVEKIKVLSFSERGVNPFLDALFKDQPEFDYQSLSVSAFNIENSKGAQLIVLDNLKAIAPTLAASLLSCINEGGSVLVFPSANCDMESYNRFLNNIRANSISNFSEVPQDLGAINTQQFIFKDVFERIPENMGLPRAKKYYQFTQNTTSNEEAILTLKDGSSFLSRYPYGSGCLLICGSPLDKSYSDLPVHAIFAPMLHKMALMNLRTSAICYFMGDKARIEIATEKKMGDKVYKIRGENTEFIPEQLAVGNKMLLGLNQLIKKAGFYNIVSENADSLISLALNFNRKESFMKFMTASQLSEKYPEPNVKVVNGAKAEIATVVKELDRGTPLWKFCLLLCLVFLAIEILLLRFWKK